MHVKLTLDPDDFHPEMQPDPPHWHDVLETSSDVVLDEDPEEPEEDDPAMGEEAEFRKKMQHDSFMAWWEDWMDRKERGEC